MRVAVLIEMSHIFFSLVETMRTLRTIICILMLAATTLANKGRTIKAPLLQPEVISGRIGRALVSQVNAASQVIVEYRETVRERKAALEVYSESSNAEADHPLFFVVKQQKMLHSWRIPSSQEQPNTPSNMTVTRTICHTPEDEYSLMVSVSTSSPTNVTFKVIVKVPQEFDLKLGPEYRKSLSPSAPLFLRCRPDMSMLFEGEGNNNFFKKHV